MSAPPGLEYHRLRAPRGHGEVLILPPLVEAGELLSHNLRLDETAAQSWLGDLRRSARQQLYTAALDHTRQYRDVAVRAYSPALPFLLAGHQPELFHAGVWFKNFVLSSLAVRHEAVGINLIADNDTLRDASIRVPTGSVTEPRVESVAYDAAYDEIPFEERTVLDERLLTTFAERVAAKMGSWLQGPLVEDLWPRVVEGLQRTRNLGEILAAARHRLEGELGLTTLEVPLSVVCRQAPLRQFVLRLLDDLPRLWTTYNVALSQYRRVNHVRSQSHPVPSLAAKEGWYEVPLWVWTTQEPRRRRLFVRAGQQGWELTDRASLRETLPCGQDAALAAWEDLERRGIKIRPRALATTMYARLILSDLFLHGIGGAKYDELTDVIAGRLLALEPPAYMTVTATLKLPIDYPRMSLAQVRAAQRQLRDLRYHGERFVEDSTSELAVRKQKLLANIPPRGAKRTWHRAMSEVNAALHQQLAQRHGLLEKWIEHIAQQHRISRLLGSREFSFVLFPREFLSTLLLDLSRVPA